MPFKPTKTLLIHLTLGTFLLSTANPSVAEVAAPGKYRIDPGHTTIALLLLSPLVPTLIRRRFAWILSLLLSTGAIGPPLLESANTAYY